MITYTVFDPDDGTGLTYRWYGEAMVYVCDGGAEVDAFEVDSPVDAPPTGDAVAQAIDEHHAGRRGG